MISDRRQKTLFALLALGLVAIGWAYRSTFASIILKWYDDAAFSHGFLIVPIVAWLVWRRRSCLLGAAMAPSWYGVLALLGCCGAWIVARGVGVLVLEQLAVVAMVAALVLAVLGPAAIRVLVFPLFFLFFAVPFGRAVVPWLMQLTADVSTVALQWSGVPVYRTHMLINIPGGWFEVARACSGLNFVLTGLVLGVLFAHLSFRSWTKRVLCVVAFVAIPILANGVRVYLTILVSHLTDMRFGPGAEHVTFGRIFFIAVLMVMIFGMRRWHDEDVLPTALALGKGTPSPEASLKARTMAPAVLAVLLVLLTPQYLAHSLAAMQERLAGQAQVAVLPHGQGHWRGPIEGEAGWQPLYRGGKEVWQGVYRAPGEPPVDAYVAVYGLGVNLGAEMISYGNVLFADEHKSLPATEFRSLTLESGQRLRVNEILVHAPGPTRLVWYWYVVGDRAVTNAMAVKVLEAAAFVFRTADSERIVTLATPLDNGARQRLDDFVEAHARCVGAGFASEACEE